MYDIPDCWDDDFWCSDIYLMLSIKLAMSHTFFWLSILNHYLLEASMRSAFQPFLVDNKLTEPKETVIKFDDDKILMLHNLYVDGMLVVVIPEHLDLVHT